MEYWEYVLLDTFFRGDWWLYQATPEHIVQRIWKFRSIEAEVSHMIDNGK